MKHAKAAIHQRSFNELGEENPTQKKKTKQLTRVSKVVNGFRVRSLNHSLNPFSKQPPSKLLELKRTHIQENSGVRKDLTLLAGRGKGAFFVRK